MPEPTFGPDKCQEDKCLNPQVQAFVHPGICLSRHLSANPRKPINVFKS